MHCYYPLQQEKLSSSSSRSHEGPEYSECLNSDRNNVKHRMISFSHL